jgi:hypothetical protein
MPIQFTGIKDGKIIRNGIERVSARSAMFKERAAS